jgi:Trm5-related predicted tRNA methylase
MFAWNSNKKATFPVHMLMTGLNPEGLLSKKMKLVGLDAGGVYEEHSSGYSDVFKDIPKEKLVYLTADSPNNIEQFDKDKVYIIGGIVDRN